MSTRPVFGLKPIFVLILLNDLLFIGFMYANYIVEWVNRLEDMFKLNGRGNISLTLTQLVINKFAYTAWQLLYNFIALYDFEYIYLTS